MYGLVGWLGGSVPGLRDLGDGMGITCIGYRCGGRVGGSIVYGRWWWCFFPCVRGSWENVRKFITLLCFFFFLLLLFEWL